MSVDNENRILRGHRTLGTLGNVTAIYVRSGEPIIVKSGGHDIWCPMPSIESWEIEDFLLDILTSDEMNRLGTPGHTVTKLLKDYPYGVCATATECGIELTSERAG